MEHLGTKALEKVIILLEAVPGEANSTIVTAEGQELLRREGVFLKNHQIPTK